MCAALPWWPILLVAARENDHDFWDELVLATCQLHAIFMNQAAII
jgi:hypothetical protein